MRIVLLIVLLAYGACYDTAPVNTTTGLAGCPLFGCGWPLCNELDCAVDVQPGSPCALEGKCTCRYLDGSGRPPEVCWKLPQDPPQMECSGYERAVTKLDVINQMLSVWCPYHPESCASALEYNCPSEEACSHLICDSYLEFHQLCVDLTLRTGRVEEACLTFYDSL